MKEKLTRWMRNITFASLMLPVALNAQETKTGYTMYRGGNYGPKGIYTVEISDTIENYKLHKELIFENVCASLLVNDKYYYMEYIQVPNGTQSIGFYSYDMEEDVVKLIADYGAALNSKIFSSLSYDYYNEVMYATGSFNGGDQLVTVNLETGDINNVATVKFDYLNETAQSYGYDNVHRITSTYDGDFYALSYWGSLYKINVKTGDAQFIAELDYNPGQAFMYAGDAMFYDNDAETLYTRFTWYDFTLKAWHNEIISIDVYDGTTKHISELEGSSIGATQDGTFIDYSIPFTVAEASAPARVNNLKVTAGAKGELSATVEWDNPEKTYGRGGTLESLTSVEIYRNGKLVETLDNPTIGGHMSWTDKGITERGYFTYKVVPKNEMGNGDRASVGTYIGCGDPMPVSDLKVVAEGSNAVLSWTAPTVGRLDSYINTESLNYDVLRRQYTVTYGVTYPTDTIATGIKETTFTDNTIEAMTKYVYSIVPHTDNATGEALEAEPIAVGPSFQIPTTFGFATDDEFALWTVIDASGDYSTWMRSMGYYGAMVGAQIQYNYVETPSNDIILSPRVHFEKDVRYKVTFDVKPGSKKVMETLAVTFGDGLDFAYQDSITQFDIISDKVETLRVNLPVIKESGNRHIGFYHRSYYANYNLTIGNVRIEEDHEGYVSGKITCDGKPVEGATVLANGGQFVATTDADGKYTLMYLPEGSYTIDVMAFGYENGTSSATVKEYETSTCDIAIAALPTYTVEGQVKDIAGDPVNGARVVLTGYDNKETSTDAEGKFAFENLFKSDNYAVTAIKNKLQDATSNFALAEDTDLGVITMSDKIKPAGKVSVEYDATTANVTWKAPMNDFVEDRIDDGVLTTAVGIQGATNNTLFGVVRREPATVSGVSFFIDGTPQYTHYSVYLTIFDLDENGNPTANELYKNTYVPCKDGEWSSYTLPAPVDCPNGYYLAISSYDYMLVGIDGGGDSETYPFQEGVNCFTSDYTTGVYLYLEGQSDVRFHHNFMIRPVAAPYTVAEDETEFQGMNAPRMWMPTERENVPQIELDSKEYTGEELDAINAVASKPMRTPQSRQRYDVYRFVEGQQADQTAWTLLSEGQQAREYVDNAWASLEQGVYYYAVKAAYTSGEKAEASISELVGNKMEATVSFNITTVTPENEAYGALVTLTNADGIHTYTGTADDNGKVTIEKVWKGVYTINIVLDGFVPYTDQQDLSTSDSFNFDVKLEENRITPYNLVIDDQGVPGERKFIWNYADKFVETFEGHPDFEINSPGVLGWQYFDGDGGETGGVANYTWPNAFSPMAYMVFNPYTTEPSITSLFYNMRPYSGDKMLTDWAAYGVPNDDYIITPKLHFEGEFQFSFYASSLDYSYLEQINVGYSMTDANPESFTWLSETPITVYSYYMQYSYNIPAGAKYVAIHCTSDQMRVLMIDDITFGKADATPERTQYYAPKANRAPSLDGQYEVYLDGEKVAQIDNTEYVFSNLAVGEHTAGVVASYTSGRTEMSTINFVVDYYDGITDVNTDALNVVVENRVLTVVGAYDSVQLFAVSGVELAVAQMTENTYDLSSLATGVYFIKVSAGNESQMLKVVLK